MKLNLMTLGSTLSALSKFVGAVVKTRREQGTACFLGWEMPERIPTNLMFTAGKSNINKFTISNYLQIGIKKTVI